jgi:hypothetical protein
MTIEGSDGMRLFGKSDDPADYETCDEDLLLRAMILADAWLTSHQPGYGQEQERTR